MKKIILFVVLILSGLVLEHKYGILESFEGYSKEETSEEGIIALSNWDKGDYKKKVINESTMILEIPIYIVGEDTVFKKVTVKYLNERNEIKNPLVPTTWYIMEGN
ncbi:MAG: hypothetical protein AAF363_02745 [Bacteroidota bacterium]